MKLNASDIVGFRELCRNHLGRDVDPATAQEEALCLIEFVRALEEPVDSDKDVAFMEDFRPPPRSRRHQQRTITISDKEVK